MKRKKKLSFVGPIFFCLPAIIALLIGAASYAGTGLTVSPGQANLGTVDEGKPAEATFIVENTGTSEVVIQGVKTNWACTRGVLGKHTLAPKQKTSLRIIFDTKDSPGPFQKIATITTSAPSVEELEVSMEGTVREAPAAKIKAAPRKIDLGSVETGSIHKKELTLTNEGSLPLEIRKIYGKETADVYFDSSKEGVMKIEPGKTQKLEMTLRPGKKGDRVQELVIIDSNAKNATKGGYVIMVLYSGK